MSAAMGRLDECLSVRDGELFVEGCRAQDLAARFGTPIHVVSENQLRRNARRFAAAFGDRWPGPVAILPSIKANPTLALRRILDEEGTGCDVFGPGELEAALRCETDPDLISLNGPMKDEALLERAVAAGVRITLDSLPELSRVRAVAQRLRTPARVRLRHRPDLVGRDEPSEMSPQGLSVRGALDRYKAGIPTEELLGLDPQVVRDPLVEVTGVHFHVGRHSADPGVWETAAEQLVGLLAQLSDRWEGWRPRELDLGGGFPAPRDPFGRLSSLRRDAPPTAPAADAYAEALCGRLATGLGSVGIEPSAIRLEVEPGRGLYADAGLHLATVGNVKHQTAPTELTWIETNSSDAYLADVNLELAKWTCLPAVEVFDREMVVADITGRTCALDVIVPDASLRAVQAGEVIAFLDTGAYQDSAASNFNALPRPGTVLVTDDGAELIRRHESLDDVFARDLVPARLRGSSPSTPDGWRPSRIDHVSVTSGDLDRSLRFYADVLGLRLRARGEQRGGDFAITGLAAAEVRWADLEFECGGVLELIEYLAPAGTATRPAPNDPGATHIALRVRDADAAFARLREAGVSVRSEPTTIESPGAWNGARAFYAVDPDGVTVELIQQPPAPAATTP